MPNLDGIRVAVLATDGFEQVELIEPRNALEAAGAEPVVVAPTSDAITGWDRSNWGDDVEVDLTLAEAESDDFDALLLPGGVMNPDTLRMNEHAVDFVRTFFGDGKPVAAICHGPQILIDADVVRSRRLTSYPAIRRDLVNAGADWVDQAVVVDDGLITSRTPADLGAFSEALISEFSLVNVLKNA
ncbi:MAG: type 1 glutamine amidotransferase domain-containing protein [Rhodothermales bacterium]